MPRWVPAVLLLVLIAAFGGVVLAHRTAHATDGIGCGGNVSYHVHAYLSIVVRGRISHPPAGVGFDYLHLCLYWLHTHDASGVIHIEAPHPITPTLGQFFAVWHQPLTHSRVAQWRVSRSEQLRAYVGRNLVPGDPAAIALHDHTVVTLEIGPPFIPPIPGTFHGLP
ncbi:MAG TPA: hypothetical protein VFB58_15335 [Chloroflexota bacterium]|nr:hypothetical protein [Chloroflexota bacterium]